VTVVRNGERMPVEVITGITDGMEVEIVAGLQPTDEIVGFNFGMYSSSPRGAAPAFGVSGIRIGGFGR